MDDIGAMPSRLAAFLCARDGTRTATVSSYEAMSGGYSRLMARAVVAWSDGTTEVLVLRGDPPPGRAMMDTDRATEWAVLRALADGAAVPMPAPRYYDATGEFLGAKCIVLDHVPGRSLHAVLNDLDPAEGVAGHMEDLVDTVARVHTADPALLAGVVDQPTDWDEYLGALINRFRLADRAHPEPVPFLRYVAAWLDSHRPEPLPMRLVHSDFQAANIMVDGDGRHQVIDWELAHIGDPREDLGYYNVYSSTSGPNLFAADPEGFLARYRERTGFSEEAVNLSTMAYFSSLAAVTVYAQILAGAAAMARGQNAGLMTTYTIPALSIGHANFLSGCVGPAGPEGKR